MRKGNRIEGIAKDALDFILEVAKSNHPREFIGMLCAENELITDVFFLPGTISSDETAIIRRDMMPMGLTYVGSVHSHPHPAAMRPSEQDLLMFAKTGEYHIIACYPYARDNWKCYNAQGEERELRIVEKDGAKLNEGEGEELW